MVRMLVSRSIYGAALLLLTACPSLADPLSGTWSEVITTGTVPPVRSRTAAIYDPAGQRMVIYGGYNGSLMRDSWALPLDGTNQWVDLAPTGTTPEAGWLHSGVFDAPRNRFLVFGGRDEDLFPCCTVVRGLNTTGTPGWSSAGAVGSVPSLSRHAAIVDPVRDRMLVFGGQDWGGSPTNQVWELSSLGGTPTWNQILLSGTPPTGRTFPSMVYDPVRDRMLVFGGRDGSNNHYNDVWALNLSGSPAWTLVATGGTPPSTRCAAAMIYDPLRDRLVVFGGVDRTPTYFSDTWELTLSGAPQWTQLSPSGPLPAGRAYVGAVYDAADDRMVIFSGADPFGRNDTWALSWASPTGVAAPFGIHGVSFTTPRPNPAGNDVFLEFTTSTPGWAQLDVIDPNGRMVRGLLAQALPEGPHQVRWNRTAADGRPVPTGVYLVRLRFGSESLTRRIIVVR